MDSFDGGDINFGCYRVKFVQPFVRSLLLEKNPLRFSLSKNSCKTSECAFDCVGVALVRDRHDFVVISQSVVLNHLKHNEDWHDE